MSEQNIAAFKRGLGAANRREFDAVLDELDPEVEWHPVLPVLLGGEATVYRGREGARELFRDVYEAFAEFRVEISTIREVDDRIVAIGSMRARGKESGAETQSPLAYLVQFKNGKILRIDSYLDPRDALEAAGLSE
jgi:ketosteroid isomerase-like protein